MLVAQTSPQLRVEHFTDPACPFAFSHEPVRWRLRWLYGDALAWRPRMIGIADSVAEMAARGLTPALLANVRTTLAACYGMPIVVDESERLRATRLAALAVVGARLAAPSDAERLLRALRVLAMAGAPIDQPDTLTAAALATGLRPADVHEWRRAVSTTETLADDMAAARQPTPAAQVLGNRLSRHNGVVRYAAPTYVIHGSRGSTFTVPGFNPAEVYETVFANLLPEARRRPAPETPSEVLDWADQPLATVEVAAVLGVDADEARRRLRDTASFHPIANDGYWTR